MEQVASYDDCGLLLPIVRLQFRFQLGSFISSDNCLLTQPEAPSLHTAHLNLKVQNQGIPTKTATELLQQMKAGKDFVLADLRRSIMSFVILCWSIVLTEVEQGGTIHESMKHQLRAYTYL